VVFKSKRRGGKETRVRGLFDQFADFFDYCWQVVLYEFLCCLGQILFNQSVQGDV